MSHAERSLSNLRKAAAAVNHRGARSYALSAFFIGVFYL
jgi:hypothetical protein